MKGKSLPLGMLPYLTQVPRILGQASEIETEFVREPYESRLVMLTPTPFILGRLIWFM